jgi:hypothetical protein
MSKKPTPTKASEGTEVRVLVDGHYGKSNTVVILDDDTLTVAVESGEVDPHPAAVAVAKGK